MKKVSFVQGTQKPKREPSENQDWTERTPRVKQAKTEREPSETEIVPSRNRERIKYSLSWLRCFLRELQQKWMRFNFCLLIGRCATHFAMQNHITMCGVICSPTNLLTPSNPVILMWRKYVREGSERFNAYLVSLAKEHGYGNALSVVRSPAWIHLMSSRLFS